MSGGWDELYVHLMTCYPGWTWEYIDGHMTFSRLDAMQAYWKKHPPLHLMVEAFVGIKTEPEPQRSDIAELVALLGEPGTFKQ